MYSSAKEVFLTTFAELDHFPQRGDARYWGVWEPDRGEPFTWPAGRGPRVFMYTHRFAARDWLLGHLRERAFPTIVYTFDLARATAERVAGQTIRLATAPLKITQAAAECDLAILNSGHNASAQFLMAGKPLFLLPISLEQGLLMRRLVEQGLAVSAPPDRPAAIEAAFDHLLSNRSLPESARAFSKQHAAYNAEAAQDEIVARIEQIVGAE
jgi:hypothetical protein